MNALLVAALFLCVSACRSTPVAAEMDQSGQSSDLVGSSGIINEVQPVVVVRPVAGTPVGNFLYKIESGEAHLMFEGYDNHIPLKQSWKIQATADGKQWTSLGVMKTGDFWPLRVKFADGGHEVSLYNSPGFTAQHVKRDREFPSQGAQFLYGRNPGDVGLVMTLWLKEHQIDLRLEQAP